MRVRIFALVVVIGIGILWFGTVDTNKLLSMIGVILIISGLIGAYFSAKNKKGVRFLRWF